MMVESTSAQPALADWRDRLATILLDADAYDPERQFVNIDRVWQSPNSLSQCTACLAGYIRESLPREDIAGLLSVDTVLYPYGPVPLAANLAVELNLKLGINKENADPLSGAHRLYGHIPSSNALLLYDVTRFGLTLLRAILAMAEEGCRPRWVVTLMDCGQGAEALVRREAGNKDHEVDFLAVLNLQTLAAASDKRRGATIP